MRLRHLVEEGDRAARILQSFLDRPDRLLGTTLVGVNLCIVVASVLAASSGRAAIGAWGEAAAGAVMTVTILIACEYLPKAWFQSQPLRRCRPFAVLLQFSWRLLRPVVGVLNWLTQWIIPSAAKESTAHPLFATKDEIDLLAKEGEAHGVLSPKQRLMIRRVVDLAHKQARAVMTPREKIISVAAQASVDECLAAARDSGFTRLPVFDRDQGLFVGIINIFDVLSEPSGSPRRRARDFMRSLLLIPEDTPLPEILPRLRLGRQPVCLVVNARSEVAGLVTTEDVLQEVVGKL
jgi:CBS domain containing-hemolysin-like protein